MHMHYSCYAHWTHMLSLSITLHSTYWAGWCQVCHFQFSESCCYAFGVTPCTLNEPDTRLLSKQ